MVPESDETKQAAASRKPPLKFSELLTAKLSTPGMRKGERTREKLKIATANLLERNGYRDLRVSDINEEADVSNALFYVYFQNKQEISLEVLTEFVTTLLPDSSKPIDHREEPIDAIFRGNMAYSSVFAANPGLMRCLIQLGDEVPEFGKLWNEWNNKWIDRTIRRLIDTNSPQYKNDAEIVATISALGVMVDGILRSIYVDQNMKVVDAYTGLGGTQRDLALFLTKLWYRVLFGRETDWQPPA